MSVVADMDVGFVATSHSEGVFSLGLAEGTEGTGRAIVFQLADDFDEQDYASGTATYSISTDKAARSYGGVQRCLLYRDILTLGFDESTASELDLPKTLRLRLLVSDEHASQVSVGLRRLGLLPSD
jgi:Immunity protein 10